MFIAWNITYWEKQMNCSLSDSMDEPYRHAGQKKRHKWLSAAWSSRVDKTNSCDQKKKIRAEVSWGRGGGVGSRELHGKMELFYVLTVVLFTKAYTFVKMSHHALESCESYFMSIISQESWFIFSKDLPTSK